MPFKFFFLFIFMLLWFNGYNNNDQHQHLHKEDGLCLLLRRQRNKERGLGSFTFYYDVICTALKNIKFIPELFWYVSMFGLGIDEDSSILWYYLKIVSCIIIYVVSLYIL